MKKGISPLIVAVILIAFVIAMAGIIQELFLPELEELQPKITREPLDNKTYGYCISSCLNKTCIAHEYPRVKLYRNIMCFVGCEVPFACETYEECLEKVDDTSKGLQLSITVLEHTGIPAISLKTDVECPWTYCFGEFFMYNC